MKILILEGIATSGKTSIINGLIKSMPKEIKARVYTEQFTHIPIIDKTDDPCNDFFTRLVSEAIASDNEVIIFDRLYLTQAYRAKVPLDKYLDVEMLLYTNYVETIFLEVDESTISKRIAQTGQHRDPEWSKYISTKGKTPEEQAAYYITQQRGLSSLLGFSILPHEAYEVVDQDYQWIIDELKQKILQL